MGRQQTVCGGRGGIPVARCLNRTKIAHIHRPSRGSAVVGRWNRKVQCRVHTPEVCHGNTPLLRGHRRPSPSLRTFPGLDGTFSSGRAAASTSRLFRPSSRYNLPSVNPSIDLYWTNLNQYIFTALLLQSLRNLLKQLKHPLFALHSTKPTTNNK